MPTELKKDRLQVKGMTCSGCEKRIENALMKIEGVESVNASSARSEAEVVYDPGRVGTDQFKKAIGELGYTVMPGSAGEQPSLSAIARLLGLAIVLFAVFYIFQNTIGFSFIPQVTQNMSFGILFVVGLITSLHCVAMCGGINLSQCVRDRTVNDPSRFAGIKPSILYNAGRVISYTLIGGIVGAIGSAFSFSPMAKGAIAAIAGIFMLIMGLNMLKIFSFLRKTGIRFPKALSSRLENIRSKSAGAGPFVVGLLNGLMPCGPLQAMQIYALGTGSAVTGALSMFFFSLGTVPLMFTFGAAGTLLSRKFTNVMFRVSGVLVIVLGFFMINNGFSLNGKGFLPSVPQKTSANPAANVSNVTVQQITTEVGPNDFPPIRVVKGIPVKWNLHVKPENLNGCNNAVVIPQYGIQKKLVPGDNFVEFTPVQTGIVPYSCWMGMIRSQIEVIDNTNAVSTNASSNLAQLPGPYKNNLRNSGCRCRQN